MLVFLWQISTVHFNYGGNWTGLFCTGATQPVPPELDAGTRRASSPVGYDGQMYRYIAHDPFFQKDYAIYVDDARLRYRRILVPLAAYLLAGGRQSIIDYAFVVVVLLSVFAGCYWSGRYCLLRNRSPWWGLIFLLSPATITSFDRMLVDGALAALFAGFLVYAERRDWRSLMILCALAALTRDTGVLFAAAVVIAAFLQREYKRAVLFALTALPAGAWAIYVAAHTRPSSAYQILTYPLLGHLQQFLVFRTDPTPWVQSILRISDLAALIGLLVCLGLAVYAIRREPVREIGICVALFVMLGLVLGAPSHLIEAYGYARPVSPVLLYLSLQPVPYMLFAPLVLTLAVGLDLAWQVIGVLKGLSR